MGNSRRSAAFIVARWIATKDFPSSMLPTGENRAFVQDIVYTTIRRIRPLRKILGTLMKQWPKGELEALLYVGAAQILYMPDVPDFAAVSETVDAAKGCENPSIAKVVNGVLRNVIRRREEFEKMIADAPLEERESFPTALVRRWERRFGVENAARLCAWHNTPAETFIARRDGSFVKLERGQCVEDVAGFADGDFIVQDPGTRLAIELLDPKEGERVLDACAAPGGKTVQIAWRGASVVACEVNPKRRRRLEENLARLKLGVEIVSELPPLPENFQLSTSNFKLFHKVLVDAPCSNTGVLRRRPDARWNWNEEKLAALVKLQSDILDACASRVAPGGVLVYSTCSNEPEENEAQVTAFLARHPDFSLEESRESIPFESGTDGAFAARLRRAP
jgi:16S rRNA (cytosine967-C5)-methyltransferase